MVLEQAESLRTGGTSLTFFKNGWKVFDAIGVGDELRPQFLEIQGCVQCVIASLFTTNIIPSLFRYLFRVFLEVFYVGENSLCSTKGYMCNLK